MSDDTKNRIRFFQGDTVSCVGTYPDANGNPVDLTGWIVLASAKLHYADPTASFSFAVTLPTASLGVFALTLSASSSMAISSSCYVFDVKGIYSGSVTRIAYGEAEVLPSVT